MKVDFMIIGAQKAATTTLCNIFRSHPNVSFCKKKEPNYFVQKQNWREHLEEYYSLFEQKDNCIYGEGSVSYTYHPHYNQNLWDELYEYNSDLKFIYMVRNPIDRIISGYMHSFERGYLKLSLEGEIESGKNALLDVTKYFFQIEPFIKKFGREKVLLIDFDDFNKNRNEELNRVADFLLLDVKLFSDAAGNHKNASIGGKKAHRSMDKYISALKKSGVVFPKSFRRFVFEKIFQRNSFLSKPKLGIDSKKKILASLENDIQQLEKLMNKDFSHWRIITEK